MARLIVTPKEAALLASIESESAFSLSQATIWAQLSPTDARSAIGSLLDRKLLKRVADDIYAFTARGISAKRRLSANEDGALLITEGDLDDQGISTALGDAIDRLK